MRDLTTFWRRIVGIQIFFWTCFLIYTSLTLPLMPLFQGPICLCFALNITFILYPFSKNRFQEKSSHLTRLLFGTRNSPSLLDIFLAIISIIPPLFIMIQWRGIAYNNFSATTIGPFNITFGFILAILLLEAGRRTVGWVISAIVLLFLGYALFGGFVPGRLGHSGFSLKEVIYQIYLMKEGITGMLLDVGSRVLPLYIVFGAVLFSTGGGETFMKIAHIACGRFRGGAGQIAMASSAMFATVSGSPVANVTATGVVTIPTMKKMGFSSELAGGIEAAASTGGQIMPPLMGAGAFLMAEFLGIQYVEVMGAALIPAILYFVGVAAGIYSQTGREGLGKIDSGLIPSLREVFRIRESICLFVPLCILVYLLVIFSPAQVAAGWALVTVTLVYVFVGGNLSFNSLKQRLRAIGHGYYVGGCSMAFLLAMVTCIQLVIISVSLTGIGVKISELIIGLGEHMPLTALILAGMVATILGMGMPTTAAYVIAIAVAAPPLIQLGFNPLAAHIFVFYFAILSGITPPVCVVVMTATTIAGGNWMRMAGISLRLAVAGFMIPFFFILNPVLLLNGDLLTIIFAGVTAIIGIFFIEVGLMGMLSKPNTILERFFFVTGGFILMFPSSHLCILGLFLLSLGILSQRFAPPIPKIGIRPSIRTTRQEFRR